MQHIYNNHFNGENLLTSNPVAKPSRVDTHIS